jgi:hypothetical protein
MVIRLFFALTVSIRSRFLFPTLCGSINTKSMDVALQLRVFVYMDLQSTAALPPHATLLLIWRLKVKIPLEKQLKKFESFVHPDALLIVQSTARHAIRSSILVLMPLKFE